MRNPPAAFRISLAALSVALACVGCRPSAGSPMRPADEAVAIAGETHPTEEAAATIGETRPAAPPPIEPTVSASPLVIRIQSTAQAPSTQLTIATLTPAPPATPAPSATPAPPAIDEAAEPVIFTSIGLQQRCGRGNVVAFDGHALRATPRLLADNSNFLEQLPENAEVDIIDCRLWTDADDLSWLAVRTKQFKLGWMLVQSDKFYVTLFPIPQEVPRALTGIPAGTTIAYVPPSECREGPVSTESTATSIGIDLIPVVGDLKGLGEAATGCDMVTGESLGNWRWFGLLGLVGLSEIALMRHADEASDVARLSDDLAGSLRYSDEAVAAAARNADTAADFMRHLDEIGAVSASADAARAAERGIGFTDEAVQALAKVEQPCSFAAGTPVQTIVGAVPIERVRPGMLVPAYDEAGDQLGLFPVAAVMAHIDTSLLLLAAGDDALLTTPDHPFLTADGWQSAGELVPGGSLLSIDGRREPVSGGVWLDGRRVMFNLTVAQAHTYAVGGGGWVVHNACSRILRNHLGEPNWERSSKSIEWQAHHIIPGEFEDHPFVRRAIDGKWKIDGAENGIALPKLEADAAREGLPAHRGSHSNYSDHVRGLLDNLEQRAVAENWSATRAREELEQLAKRLRNGELKRYAGRRLN